MGLASTAGPIAVVREQPMKAFNLPLRIAGAMVLLLGLQSVSSHFWSDVPFTTRLGLPALSSLLVVLALALVAASSDQYGWRLSATLFILYFGINYLNTLDETLIFKVGLSAHEVFRLMAAGFCTALIFSPLLVLILSYWNAAEQEEIKPLVPRSAAGWVGRIVLGDLLYVLCYFIAGMATFPFVKDFYAGIKVPDPATIIEMEIFRGLVYVAAGLAVVHGMKGKRGRAAAALGLSFPILAGVAPLLLHSPYLPGYVRLAHGFEIGISNLAYGALLGHILTRKAAPVVNAQRAESPEFLP
ncbi:MAG: hypothetical protein P8Z30_19665 [Acidobacteriota bacterium]